MAKVHKNTKDLISVWKKTTEEELFTNLKSDYGFSNAISRSLVKLFNDYADLNYGDSRNESQMIYHAISVDEGPGKSISELKKVSVSLTISEFEDKDVLESEGISGLRKHKLLRFANEAYSQNGLLNQEDLAILLTTSIRTIQRDIQELKMQGIIVPTRGSIQDIGPTLSHKPQVIELYLKGYEYTDITLRTRHSSEAIKRYIKGFSKVILLLNKGYSALQIRELTNQSEKVVQEYIKLYEDYKEIGKERLDQILNLSDINLDSKKGGGGVTL